MLIAVDHSSTKIDCGDSQLGAINRVIEDYQITTPVLPTFWKMDGSNIIVTTMSMEISGAMKTVCRIQG